MLEYGTSTIAWEAVLTQLVIFGVPLVVVGGVIYVLMKRKKNRG